MLAFRRFKYTITIIALVMVFTIAFLPVYEAYSMAPLIAAAIAAASAMSNTQIVAASAALLAAAGIVWLNTDGAAAGANQAWNNWNDDLKEKIYWATLSQDKKLQLSDADWYQITNAADYIVNNDCELVEGVAVLGEVHEFTSTNLVPATYALNSVPGYFCAVGTIGMDANTDQWKVTLTGGAYVQVDCAIDYSMPLPRPKMIEITYKTEQYGQTLKVKVNQFTGTECPDQKLDVIALGNETTIRYNDNDIVTFAGNHLLSSFWVQGGSNRTTSGAFGTDQKIDVVQEEGVTYIVTNNFGSPDNSLANTTVTLPTNIEDVVGNNPAVDITTDAAPTIPSPVVDVDTNTGTVTGWLQNIYTQIAQIIGYLNPASSTFFLRVAFVPNPAVLQGFADSLNNNFHNKFQVIAAYDQIQLRSGSDSNNQFEDVYVILPVWGEQKIIEGDYLNSAGSFFKNILIAFVGFLTIIFTFKRLANIGAA